jgi:hypothetical protein
VVAIANKLARIAGAVLSGGPKLSTSASAVGGLRDGHEKDATLGKHKPL